MSFLFGAGVGGTAILASTISRPTDTDSISVSNYQGEVLNPDSTLSRVDVEISGIMSGISEVGIYDGSGNELAKDSSVSSAGDVGVLDGLSLSVGTDYSILVYAGGSSYTLGYEADNHPYTASDGDLVRGVSGSSPGSVSGSGQVRAINNVDLFV